MMIMQSPNEQERFRRHPKLIIEAGDLALQYFGNLAELSIMSKGARDMVSDADLAVEKLINEPVAGDGLYSSHSVMKRGLAWMCMAS
jgi:fructose-1,6-bisphosphatase/inositol monophosphatase family enzyme